MMQICGTPYPLGSRSRSKHSGGLSTKTADMKVYFRLEWDLRLDNSLIRGVYLVIFRLDSDFKWGTMYLNNIRARFRCESDFNIWYCFISPTDHFCPGFRLESDLNIFATVIFPTDRLSIVWPGFRLESDMNMCYCLSPTDHLCIVLMADHQVTFPRCIIDIIFLGIQISIRF